MATSAGAPTPFKFRCVYCGVTQEWDQPGTPVCSHCGAAQPDQKTAAATIVPGRSRRAAAIAAILVVVALAAYGAHRWLGHGTPTRSAPAKALAAADAPVSGSRIQRVDKPHIRVIPEDVHYTFEDLMTVPENAPPAPDFDTHQLVISTPRRMTTEKLDTVFLGELVNNSPDQVAVTPQVTLTLTRGGRKVDSADNSYPDLPPGAHVPVFFHYEGTTKSFDAMNFVWKPAKAYTVGAPGHPQLTAAITSQKQENSDSLHVPERFRYQFIRVAGTISNKGERLAKDVYVYVLLRDAKGLLTGYSRQVLSNPIPAGATASFDSAAVIWGEPAVKVEALALPTSQPSL